MDHLKKLINICKTTTTINFKNKKIAQKLKNDKEISIMWMLLEERKMCEWDLGKW